MLALIKIKLWGSPTILVVNILSHVGVIGVE